MTPQNATIQGIGNACGQGMKGSGVQSAQMKTVIEVKATRGSGTKEDPFRTVSEYWSPDGEFLAVRDYPEFEAVGPEGPRL